MLDCEHAWAQPLPGLEDGVEAGGGDAPEDPPSEQHPEVGGDLGSIN